MGETTGFVKFIADAKTDELLGAHMIGPNVSELIAEVVLGVRVSRVVGGHRHHGARAPDALRGDEGSGAGDPRPRAAHLSRVRLLRARSPAAASRRLPRDARAAHGRARASRRTSTARSRCWSSPSAGTIRSTGRWSSRATEPSRGARAVRHDRRNGARRRAAAHRRVWRRGSRSKTSAMRLMRAVATSVRSSGARFLLAEMPDDPALGTDARAAAPARLSRGGARARLLIARASR